MLARLAASALRAWAWDAPGTQAVQARKVPACKKLGTCHSDDGMVFLKRGGCQLSKDPLFSMLIREWGPEVPCWAGDGEGVNRQTRFGCDLHVVVLRCARDACFWRQGAPARRGRIVDWYDSHNAAPIKQQKRSSKATHVGAQGRSVVAGLVSAYRLSFRNGRTPKRLASGL